MSEVVISDFQKNLIDNFHENAFDYDLHEESIDLSLLRLDSFGGSTDLLRKPSSRLLFPSADSAVSGIPFKRRSPENSGIDEPKPKKLFLQPRLDSQQPVSSKGNGLFSLPSVAPAVTRRCVSDLTSSPSKTASMCSSSSSMMGSEALTEENSKSDQMLMIVKDGARQMTDWCDKLLQYGEDLGFEGQNRNSNLLRCGENEFPGVHDQNDASKEGEEESEKDCEGGGSVKVERISDAVVLQFSCPCRKSYKILFSKDECYYKLL